MVFGILGMENVPKRISLHGIVPGDGAHVGEFVPHGHNFGIVRGSGQTVDGGLLAGMPAVFLAYALHKDVAFRHYQIGDAVPELPADVIGRDVGVLHNVVQGRCGEQLLVRGDGGHNFHGLHGMDNVGEAFAATLRAGMRLHRKDDGTVQKFCIERFVCHVFY